MNVKAYLWVAHASRVPGERVLAIAHFPLNAGYSLRAAPKAKPVSARRRKSEPDWHLHARRVRYP